MHLCAYGMIVHVALHECARILGDLCVCKCRGKGELTVCADGGSW